jgi:hypothetical protein
LDEQLKGYLAQRPLVVALGRAAKDALGDRATHWLPHPVAARLNESRHHETVERKLRQIRKALDEGRVAVEDNARQVAQPIQGEPLGPDPMGQEAARPTFVKVAKAADEKQIVYGTVSNPHEIDTQNEWLPPAEVEQTAHGYMKKSRVIGLEHREKANAQVVESWLVPYPSERDHDLAMQNRPHSAYEMQLGSDKVRSGTWIMGVQLGDSEWASYKRGDITGFSVGGFSYKTKMPASSMPHVDIVSLAPKF